MGEPEIDGQKDVKALKADVRAEARLTNNKAITAQAVSFMFITGLNRVVRVVTGALWDMRGMCTSEACREE